MGGSASDVCEGLDSIESQCSSVIGWSVDLALPFGDLTRSSMEDQVDEKRANFGCFVTWEGSDVAWIGIDFFCASLPCGKSSSIVGNAPGTGRDAVTDECGPFWLTISGHSGHFDPARSGLIVTVADDGLVIEHLEVLACVGVFRLWVIRELDWRCSC